jgi:hypothetical protein
MPPLRGGQLPEHPIRDQEDSVSKEFRIVPAGKFRSTDRLSDPGKDWNLTEAYCGDLWQPQQHAFRMIAFPSRFIRHVHHAFQ